MKKKSNYYKKKNSSIKIYGLLLIIIGIMTIGIIQYLSDEDTILYTTFLNFEDTGCRIVIDGNVCDEYTKCEYLPERDVSCIVGYKIITPPDTIPIIMNSMTNTGGSAE